MFLAVTVLIVVIAVWQIAYAARFASRLVLPSPGNTVASLGRGLFGGEWWPHIQITLVETLLAFAIGLVAALVIGSVFAFLPLVRKSFYPYVIAIQTFPKIAIAPLLVTWLGYGLAPKIAIGALLAFFPIFTNTVAGFTEVDRDELDLMRSLRAGWRQQLRYLLVPNAVTYIFPALNVAAVNSLLGVIVGEFVGAQEGLGYIIQQKAFLGDIAGVFAVLLILAAIGLGLFFVVKFVESRFTKFNR